MPSRIEALWSGLAPERLHAVARNYAEELVRDGLTVFKPGTPGLDGAASPDEWLAIPPLLTPKVIARDRLDDMCASARALTSALVRLTRHLCGPSATPAERALTERMFATLTPLERAFDLEALGRIATARVDHFVDAEGPRALELNATIPAMQGYSDLIARRFISTVARERDPDPVHAAEREGRALVLNGSNTADLLASLEWHAHALGAPTDRPLAIAIVCRRGDAQLGELAHYARAFSAAGHAAEQLFVDEVQLDASGAASARGHAVDLIYRHIFARRVDPGSDFASILREPTRHRVLNPIASPLEIKAMLGLLSELADDDARAAAVGLGDDERAATRARVPWTRVLADGPSTGPDGAPIADLRAWVRAHASELVLKKSWDYGGKRVVLGPDVIAGVGRERLAELTAPHPPTWDGLISAIMDGGPDLWVVQRLVVTQPERHLVADREQPPSWRDLHVDVSAYASLGGPAPRGGVCRASASRIVNILGGGGLAPTLTDQALAALLD